MPLPTWMKIRPEISSDKHQVYAINLAAFPTPAEAELVGRLQRNAAPLVSLVAEQQGSLLGHILFSPVILDTAPSLRLMGLAPMAVIPGMQRQGIGSALVEAGLKHCEKLGIGAVAVLGHPGFYPKFGFVSSSYYSIKSEYDVAAEVFMLRQLLAGTLKNTSGTIRYHVEFGKSSS